MGEVDDGVAVSAVAHSRPPWRSMSRRRSSSRSACRRISGSWPGARRLACRQVAASGLRRASTSATVAMGGSVVVRSPMRSRCLTGLLLLVVHVSEERVAVSQRHVAAPHERDDRTDAVRLAGAGMDLHLLDEGVEALSGTRVERDDAGPHGEELRGGASRDGFDPARFRYSAPSGPPAYGHDTP